MDKDPSARDVPLIRTALVVDDAGVVRRLSFRVLSEAGYRVFEAAGAVEAIYSVLAIRDNVAPPTLNLDNPSVETAIDLVPHKAQKRPIDTVLSNSFGFGGTNASIVMRRLAA